MRPSLLVVGSLAFDTLETPSGIAKDELGGSATYFSHSASHLAPKVRLVGVVGKDFPKRHIEEFRERSIDTAGIQVVPAGKTFRWHGRYRTDMSNAETVSVELNVFGKFAPQIPASFRKSPFVFLANGSPTTQRTVLDQVEKPVFVLADTMNLWIETARKDLLELIHRVDGLILNNTELLQLSGESNVIAGARWALAQGPRVVVIKKGEHGSMLFVDGEIVALPAYPLEHITDPTGAGDSFAGGFMGHLTRCGGTSLADMKRALVYGTVIASFTCEDFGLRRLFSLTDADIERRVAEFAKIVSVDVKPRRRAKAAAGR
ncbi:MAG: sugar kinase [Candidatus Brocadiae bacterium]|nr:sugar kinase [Candidatus Brocadiia bacterium]